MNPFVITTDTAADLPESYIKESRIEVLPLYYNLGGTIYGGESDLSPEDFYKRMRNGQMPTTMAVNPEHAKEVFRKHLEAGEDILHIALSSALSGSCNNAVLAANELLEEFPNRRLIVVDSFSVSLGEGLLVYKANKLKEQGRSIIEVAAWLEENKFQVCHLFTVDDLFHLQRGGRISKAAAILGTMINVKPVLHVDKDGKLAPLHNVRGRKKALTALVDHMQEQMAGFEEQNDLVFISHGDCIDDAKYVADLVNTRLGIASSMIHFVSPTIGSHSGPGTVALFFLGHTR